MATRSHCRTGYNCHWVALQAGCAQQSGSVGPRVALQGVNYTTIQGTAWPPLTQRGAQSRGILSWGEARARRSSNNQSSRVKAGGGKRVEWAGRRLFCPHWSCLLQPYHTTITYYIIPFHTIAALTIPYHACSYHTIPYLPWLLP